MDKLYYADSYQKTVSCTVTSVEHTDKATLVRTDRTIFYPEGGGQCGDTGMLGTYKVLDTRKAEDGDSVLVMEKNIPIMVGQTLELVLDWDHRYKFMVIHTAQHLLSGLLFTMFGIGTVAVHQGAEYLTIETDKGEMPQETIDALILSANARIRENHRVFYREMSHKEAEELGLRRSIKVEGDVRIVEIEGVDRIACGGVHVASTGEIGLVYCLGHEQIRGHVRLYFSCGQDALDSLLLAGKVVHNLNTVFSCHTDELLEKVSAMQAQLAEAKVQGSRAQRRLSELEIRGAVDGEGLCIIRCEEGADLQNYAQAVPLFEDLAMLCLCPDNGRTKWLVALKGRFERINFNVMIRPLLAKIDAKGGGRTPVFQGVANCTDKAALDGFVEAFKESVNS